MAEVSGSSLGSCVPFANALIDTGFLSRDPAAAPIEGNKALAGHTSIVDWTDFCGEPTRKKIERQSPATNGNHVDADWLTKLVMDPKIVAPVTGVPPGPHWSIFLIYKFIKKGKDKDAIHDTRWDKLNSPRQIPWCRRVAEAYEGDVQRACRTVYAMGDYYERNRLTWDMSTILKRLTDFEEGRFGKDN